MSPEPFANPVWGMIDVLVPYAANLVLHSTVLGFTGLAFVWLLRKQGAVLQSLVIRTFLAAVLLSPLVTMVVQSAGVHGIMIDIPRVAPADKAQRSRSSFNLDMTAHAPALRPYSEAESPRFAEAVEGFDRTFSISVFSGPDSRRAFSTLFLAIWLSLSLLYSYRLVVSYVKVLRLRYHSEDASWEDIRTCREVAHELEVEAPIVLKSSLTGGPFLAGLIKPILFLPTDVTVSREVMYHEIAHLARHDCFWNVCAVLGIVLIPVQPLMYVMARRIEQLSDYVCDDYVLECRGNKKVYAHQLLDLAERYKRLFRPSMIGAGAVKSKSELRHRIERLLRQQRVRIANGCRTILVVFGVTAILGFTVGSVFFNNKSHRMISAFFPFVSIEPVNHPESPEIVEMENYMVEPVVSDSPEKPVDKAADAPGASPGDQNPLPVEPDAEGRVVTASLAHLFIPREEEQVEAPAVDEEVSTESPDDHIHSIRTLIEKQSQPLTIDMVLERLDLTEEDIATYEACRETGETLIKTRRYMLAEKILEHALTEFGMNDPAITNLLGEVYLGKGEIELARYYFKKAIILDPERSKYHYNLANVYWAMGNHVEAMSQFGKATEMNPSYANSHKWRN